MSLNSTYAKLRAYQAVSGSGFTVDLAHHMGSVTERIVIKPAEGSELVLNPKEAELWLSGYVTGRHARTITTIACSASLTRSVGIPYGRTGFDVIGYYVVCPRCDERCRSTDPQDEDAATKSAARAYAQHFTEVHG